ncbi:unnamed protein product, partial [Prunus brigantina]
QAWVCLAAADLRGDSFPMEEGSLGVLRSNNRFSKRSRVIDDGDAERGMDSESDSPLRAAPEHNQVPTSSPAMESFKDKLMSKVNLVKNVGIDVNRLDDVYDNLNDVDDVEISKGEKGPSIQFSERAMSQLCKPWQNALIIKLLGRSHTFNYLQSRLQQKWSLKGGWKLVDLINDYYVVKFDLEEDLNFVLTGGPWIIGGQYLIMQKWRSGFCPASAQITRMAAWIRVSALQLECFDVWALKRIGNLLGKLLKIDTLTTSQNRGKFARLCVEIDLTKPLEAFVQINQVWYNIEYEGLPEICYTCGLYGHKKESCELNKNLSDKKAGEGSGIGAEEALGDDFVMEKEGIVENLRGPWMIVQNRRKPKSGVKDGGNRGAGGPSMGSRFDALGKMNEDFDRNGGFDTGKTNLVEPNHIGTSKGGGGMGKKLWTKSKASKSGARPVLNDISNKAFKEKINVHSVFSKVSRPSNPTPAVVTHKGNLVADGKINPKPISLNEQLAHWVNGQNAYNATGAYQFGHQPPNIRGENTKHVEVRDTIAVVDPLALPNNGDLIPADNMDLGEGHIDPPMEAPNDCTSIDSGGINLEL